MEPKRQYKGGEDEQLNNFDYVFSSLNKVLIVMKFVELGYDIIIKKLNSFKLKEALEYLVA